ncbi:MAG: hypothetical protein AB7L17_05810 [Ilumatobacteraceae bacterium]
MRVPRTDALLPDRSVEVDLDWFEPGDAGRVEEFVGRVTPVLAGHRDHRSVVLNPGFLADILTEFDGDPGMRLPLRSSRYARWRDCTYADLAWLAAELRRCAAAQGIDGLRVGIFVAGVGRVITGSDLYDLASDWCDRHPELYPFDLSPLPGPDLDPRVPLRGDDHRYASRPDGIAEGTSFGEFLADQWADVAATCGLDVIHLRDGFWGPMLYTRKGPYGVRASDDAKENATWTAAVRDLFAAVKAARPEALVMAYTSGIGATAEWRCGCVDTEEVLRGGGVDVLIDQTWGGAWQDWWDDWWKGWTNQHVNLLSHAVAVRRSGNPVRHYKLIETWDGWEPFDTVHAVPQKLRWAMWAWSHAAVATPDGLEVADGTYISWMNDRDRRLLDADAVEFVASNLDAAETDAATMTAVGGPLVVFDHDGVARQHERAPRDSISEHVEDAVALLMKWGTPVLGATDVSWTDAVDTHGGAIVQAGGSRASIDGPVMMVGRADRIGADLLGRAGVTSVGQVRPRGYHREAADDARLSDGWVHLSGDAEVEVADEHVLVRAGGQPTLAASDEGAWWQPPDLSDPANPLLPRSQYGSVASAVRAARWWSNHSDVRTAPPDVHLPVTVQSWRTGDRTTVLLGNLETGWVGDSRSGRCANITVDGGRSWHRFDVPPEGCVVATLEPSGLVTELSNRDLEDQ